MMNTANATFGLNGFDHVADTDPHAGSWYAIKAVGGDATGAFTMEDGDSLAAFTVAENDWLYGHCTAVTLTEGAILAYRTHKTV